LLYSHEGQDFGAALETAGGICRALPLLCPPGGGAVFWVLAGDVYTPGFVFDPAVVAAFEASGHLAHLWLVPNPAHNPRGDFGLDTSTGLALNLSATDPRPRYTYSTIGLYHRPTAPERSRNRDSEFLFRHDSYFYYLSGFSEPNAWLVITADGHSTLFCQPKDLEREIWDGIRLGPDEAPAHLGVDAAYSVAELDARLPKLLENRSAVWYPFATHQGLETRVDGWLNAVRARVRYGALCPQAQHDLCALLDEMRLIKDAHEQAIMRRAAQISAGAHIRAMQRCAAMLRAGQDVREYHLDAELLHEFRQHGSQYPAYSSIVAAGANACVLHYRADTAPIRNGELVLIDAGCELDGYASDITRTFPANGRFTGPQRALYDLVLASQDAAIAATKPGARFTDPHEATVKVLTQGMLDLGLLDRDQHGTLDDAIHHRALLRPLHAPHRPLAGHGRARLRQLRRARRGRPDP
jgi:Xaa-Pro aminopeptidase